jgi:3-phosphoshikimate 1-carboxyvinyltransferase
MNITVYPKKYNGKIHIPASKSDSQRAFLAAALCQGVSIIYNVGNSHDELAMLKTIQELGARITLKQDSIEICGLSSFPNDCIIDCGESGLGSRLLMAVCASQKGEFTLNASGSLLNRSMRFYKGFFAENNILASFSKDACLPVTISGGLKAGEFRVDGSQSSQYISGLLMALPLLQGSSKLIAENLTSTPYVDMTLATLKEFGIEINQSTKEIFEIEGKQCYKSTNYTVESDWSSASFWLVASALGHEVSVTGLSMNSFQADNAIVEILQHSGCKVIIEENGEISVNGTNKHSFKADLTHSPDLFPILAVYAVFCEGTTVLKGVTRLANKESNRGLAIQQEFAKLGVSIEILEDEMMIVGKQVISGGKINSHNDHRIAMAFAILGISATLPIEIEGADAVAKSYPTFWEEMERLSGN